MAAPIEKRTFLVEPGVAGERLDAFLARRVEAFSRSRLKALIKDGRVRVEGAVLEDPSARLAAGAEVALNIPAAKPAKPQAETISLKILYEDDDIIVIDKPAGLVVHPGAGNVSGTLVNALIAHCGDSLSGIGGVKRPGIVHRLDKDTSGVLVVAKNDAAHQRLSAQFAAHGRDGALQRRYKAIVWGVPDRARGSIDRPIARSAADRRKMAVAKSGGRHAVTHYVVEKTFGPRKAPVAALLDCRLETGRTHQIRVHMAAIGHPLIGDAQYGAGFKTKAALLPEPARAAVASLNRQALHAWLLGFNHPATGRALRFESPLPPDIAGAVAALEQASLAEADHRR